MQLIISTVTPLDFSRQIEYSCVISVSAAAIGRVLQKNATPITMAFLVDTPPSALPFFIVIFRYLLLQPSAALAQSQPHIGAPRSKGALIIPRRYPVEQPTKFVFLFSTRPPASRKIGICCHNIPGHNGGSDNPSLDCAGGLASSKIASQISWIFVINDPTRDNSSTDAEEALFQRLLRRLGEVKQSAVRWSRNSRFCGCGCSWKRRSQRRTTRRARSVKLEAVGRWWCSHPSTGSAK